MNPGPQRMLRWTGRLWEAAAEKEDKRDQMQNSSLLKHAKGLSKKIKSMSKLNSTYYYLTAKLMVHNTWILINYQQNLKTVLVHLYSATKSFRKTM